MNYVADVAAVPSRAIEVHFNNVRKVGLVNAARRHRGSGVNLALADADDGAWSREEDLGKAGAEDFAGEGIAVNAERDEVGAEFASQVADGDADFALDDVNVSAGRNGGQNLPADGGDGLGFGSGRDHAQRRGVGRWCAAGPRGQR